MRPFNLSEALAGKPVQTRGGIVVKDLHHMPSSESNYKLVATANGIPMFFTEAGKQSHLYSPNDNDLAMVSERVTRWVNLYRGNPALATRNYKGLCLDCKEFCSRDSAMNDVTDANRKYLVDTIKISWEE